MMKFPSGIAPILLLIGTIGLLLNEFVFHWGRIATLSFAALSAVGLIWFTSILMRERRTANGEI
jgi:hypothetical protein